MRNIPLTQGYEAIVDDEDYPLLSRHTWHIGRSSYDKVYAQKTFKGKVLLMTDLISPQNTTGPRMLLDHINGNSLDNRKENLRFATHSGNSRNMNKVHGHSKYKGVSLNKNRWTAGIWVDGKRKHLGNFNTELEAANAYDEAALEYFGEFARTNKEIHNA